MPLRSNHGENYLPIISVCLLSSEGISVRVQPPAFTNAQALCGRHILSRLRHSLLFDCPYFMLLQTGCQVCFHNFIGIGLYFSCFPQPFVFPVFLASSRLTNDARHVIFSSITNAMTMLRIPHRFQRAGGWCEPAAGRTCGLPSEQKDRT